MNAHIIQSMIETEYENDQRHEKNGADRYKSSWSFLYTPVKTLHSRQQLMFLGLNPGGPKNADYSTQFSSESGNAYIVGDWSDGKGLNPLQEQVCELYCRIAKSMQPAIPYETVMDNSLAANYVPFRSSSWATQDDKSGTLAFSDKLWKDVLEVAWPKVIICISLVAHQRLTNVLTCEKGCHRIALIERQPVGWGEKVTYDVHKFCSAGRSELHLVRVPHLSRYRVITQPRCQRAVDEIVGQVAAVLDPESFRVTPIQT